MADKDMYYGDYSQDGGEQTYEYGEEENADYGDAVEGATDLSTKAATKEVDDDKKLFVGGLGWGTTQDDLQTHFAKFGGIVEVTIKTNPTTGRSRGFAFIQFAGKDSVDRVLMSGPHMINGTQVEPKRVQARRSGYNKIFVGGLDPDLPESEIRAYFMNFGKIEGIELPYDKVRNQRKQFCFVAFESEDVVEQICKHPKQRIGGRECDVKKATRRQGGRGGSNGRGGFGATYGYSYGIGVRRRGRGRGRGYSQSNRSWDSNPTGGYNYSSYTPNYNTQPNYGQSYEYGSYSGYGK